MTLDLNDIIKALSNPTRLQIMQWLKDPRVHFPSQERDPEEIGVCVSIIQEKVGLSQSTVSLYLTALQRADLVTSQRLGPWTYYRRNEKTIAQFVEQIGASL
ncbi:MAG: helix-turn-helix transcriptional regulator [Pseudomonas prosekii]|jgi:DNA-binding transcriptional ArsR family regulator|uniref:Transcriptional regulator n=1 Tax=Pseudomonas prosekii TaxID=1148509 RepID=A0A3L8CB13_9PSED|nr:MULTISPECIES: helix-turn-helix transcriptional regulator [Pseudomonas]RLU05031.1 transcriptional regulator [Pseudomonas prosekii]RLU05406.1 transcriptional regulator [Pseudomonas prosekii]TWD51711.1 ArsR family transcriptional regulator [Pseudomonas sp. SJZ131]